MRWLAVDHFDRRDTEGPDIRLEVVASLLDHFRRHPEWRSNESIALRLDVDQLGRHAEVRQLHLPGIREQHVGSLDIAVNLAFGVEVVQSLQQLLTDDCNMSFVKDPWFQLRPVSSSPRERAGVAHVPDQDTTLRPGIP